MMYIEMQSTGAQHAQGNRLATVLKEASEAEKKQVGEGTLRP